MSINKLDLSQPVYLQFDSKKFWEISLVKGNETLIRFGKLTQNVEVESTIQKIQKVHKSYDECVAYIKRVIDVKRLKGYQGDDIPKKPTISVVDATAAAPASASSSQNKPSSSGMPFMIKVSAAVEEETKKSNAMEEEKEDEEEDSPAVDPKSQCFLQQNSSWKAKFVILTRTKKSVQEITGQVGPRPNWSASTTDLNNEASAIQYLEGQIEQYEEESYTKSNEQYFIRLGEYNTWVAQNSNSTGLQLPSAGNRGRQMNSPQRKNSDSHSNISDSDNNSDRTSRNSSLDLSFDGNDSNISSVSSTGITPGSLGKTGKLEGGVLLAEAAPDDMDPTGWIGSEKMDGVRAIWTGSTFYSRNGNEFFPPDFFIKNFPKCTLDGELFTKRDDFQRCVAIIKNQNKKKDKALDERWKEITYLVYDAPHLNKPFRDRILALQTELPKVNSPYIRVLPHIVMKDKAHLEEQLDKTLEKKGEGIMLRNPESFYENRRSKNLLKVKVFIDEEAVVTGSEKGTGRCSSMMGAINCRLKNGIEFKIGSGFTDAQRMKPPKIGCTVTFKYQNLSKEGKPRFPIFLRIKQGSDF